MRLAKEILLRHSHVVSIWIGPDTKFKWELRSSPGVTKGVLQTVSHHLRGTDLECSGDVMVACALDKDIVQIQLLAGVPIWVVFYLLLTAALKIGEIRIMDDLVEWSEWWKRVSVKHIPSW